MSWLAAGYILILSLALGKSKDSDNHNENDWERKPNNTHLKYDDKNRLFKWWMVRVLLVNGNEEV